jgi:hypothetical protein
MSRTIILLATLSAALTIGVTSLTPAGPALAGQVTAVAAGTATPYCGISWGSLPKNQDTSAVSPLTGIRAGRHDCFDRLVLDFAGKTDGYRLEYVPEVTTEASGDVVPLRGGAKLQIVMIAPATYTPADRHELVDVTGWRTFRQVAWAGSFEGYTRIGLGVRGRLPFRVFTLDGPGAGSRIVIDVAQFW